MSNVFLLKSKTKKVSKTKKINKLNTYWTIYFHNLTDTDWSLKSYKKVFVVHTIEDFWIFFNNFTRYRSYMIFIMRENIKPIYEDPLNQNGGSFSYVLRGKITKDMYLDTLMRMIGETLVPTQFHRNINGISLVPKKHNILKIWTKNKNKNLKIQSKLKMGRFNLHFK